jgi:hypothetical protein
VALRAAQWQPGHWGLSAHDPVGSLAELVEDGDPVLAIGASDGACALFLAARGAEVRVADPDIAAVYGLENRAVNEQLGARIECEVVQLERFAPSHGSFTACVIETGVLAPLAAPERGALIQRLKAATPEPGRHAVMPSGSERGAGPRLSSDALRSLYTDWQLIRAAPAAGRRSRNTGFTAVRIAPESH